MIFQKDTPLTPYNTFGLPAIARRLAICRNEDALAQWLKANPGANPLLLGGGSNILLTRDVEQPVILNRIMGKKIVHATQKEALVQAGAGENWHELVNWAVAQGLGGLENLALIPGTAGAAPIQNIGAYGVELSDVLVEVQALEMATGKRAVLSAADCKLGYRSSIFKSSHKGQFVITGITLRLSRPPHQLSTTYGAIQEELSSTTAPTPDDVRRAVIRIRQSKLPDPASLGNSGSFFKNPELPQDVFQSLKAKCPDVPGYPLPNGHTKVPAGWLIDRAGWKGKRSGAVGTYPKQALVIVHYGGGTGAEVWAFAQRIAEDVARKFGIHLEPEVNII